MYEKSNLLNYDGWANYYVGDTKDGIKLGKAGIWFITDTKINDEFINK